MNASKLNRETDNVDTKGLLPTFRQFVESIDMPVDGFVVEVKDMEWQRRDGFIPADHNRGGIDLIVVTDIASMIGSGTHTGTTIDEFCEKEYWGCYEYVKANNPELDEEEILDTTDGIMSDDYCHLAWRVRIMYNGNNQVSVYVGWDTDGPYFRWKRQHDSEYQIQFTDSQDLTKKLVQLALEISYNGK